MTRSSLGLCLATAILGLLWLSLWWRPTAEDGPVLDTTPEPLADPPPLAATQPPPQSSVAPVRRDRVVSPEPEVRAPESPEEVPYVDPMDTIDPAYGTRESDELIRTDQGPVVEYRALYQSEPRDYDAGRTEAALSESFGKLTNANELVRTISCRETICKLDLRWSMARMQSYLAGITNSQSFIDHVVAVSPVGPPDSFGVRPVELYVKRKAATRAQP